MRCITENLCRCRRSEIRWMGHITEISSPLELWMGDGLHENLAGCINGEDTALGELQISRPPKYTYPVAQS
ncbi:hypothetical protein SERLA73DRAFT_181063 [Serpula lacrymans var. lacrymans S7.3]|uniref:Uncharacterized protein n=2 Tax=Serpula lacrymans var. lacrymans TaxID=341189 RepID=F8PUQ4_SERL3|nr:uncharacterized protein SERLADRAFT_466938 [Serpula lacrymans var. lacrymans S7.9]EGO00462.1 hypothetical protein SERLA73DRAFT_181063 [Serpula lacrymans var. lacrymans S7.3]EGO26013.1 hypothetical protein SERLADRAFT_466938 [Serpula lacrymans var. lacrymans S7.9]